MDYEKNNYLPSSMRDLIGEKSRVTANVEESFLRLFQNEEAMAVMNNYRAYETASGFVPRVNYQNLMTGTGPRLSEILVSKICGKVALEGIDIPKDATDEEKKNQRESIQSNMQIFKSYMSEAKLTRILKQAFGDSIDSGRGVIFLNFANNKVQTRIFNCFRCSLKYDIFGDIIEARAFINIDSSKPFEDYILTEKRFYRDNEPYQMYVVTRSVFGNANKKNEITEYAKLKDLPENIREKFKNYELYSAKKLDNFMSLGVYSIDNTIKNRKYKYCQIPESQFINIQDLLIERDVTETQKVVEQNLARGRVLIPSFMGGGTPTLGTNPRGQNVVIGAGKSFLDKTVFTQYESKSLDDSKPANVQFDFRAEQWRSSISGVIGDICAAFGVSVLDFDPRLLQAGQRTDDEINAMTDITAATVQDKREMNEEVINQFLNQIAVCVGVKMPVFIRWSMSSILNPTKNEDLIGKKLANGTISRESAIKQSNPDYTDEEVAEELERINNERNANMSAFLGDDEE